MSIHANVQKYRLNSAIHYKKHTLLIVSGMQGCFGIYKSVTPNLRDRNYRIISVMEKKHLPKCSVPSFTKTDKDSRYRKIYLYYIIEVVYDGFTDSILN